MLSIGWRSVGFVEEKKYEVLPSCSARCIICSLCACGTVGALMFSNNLFILKELLTCVPPRSLFWILCEIQKYWNHFVVSLVLLKLLLFGHVTIIWVFLKNKGKEKRLIHVTL